MTQWLRCVCAPHLANVKEVSAIMPFYLLDLVISGGVMCV